MKIIEREELKAKLDRGDDFKLVMTLGELAYQAQHIPGSINLSKLEDIESTLQKDDEIVVYCSDQACIASQAAYIMMEKKGYTNVRRYAGGLSDWNSAGYNLEGFSTN
ncbi:MAG: rhodanese-like domain-containing protein [Anaerolineales bacterium]|nr:rhodanese-like domain-containing protein [Anaerolineales bacterium]